MNHLGQPLRIFLGQASFRAAILIALALRSALGETGLPKEDLEFLREMTRDVIQASRVKPGSNGGGKWTITNSCGFALITPGKDTYIANEGRRKPRLLHAGSRLC